MGRRRKVRAEQGDLHGLCEQAWRQSPGRSPMGPAARPGGSAQPARPRTDSARGPGPAPRESEPRRVPGSPRLTPRTPRRRFVPHPPRPAPRALGVPAAAPGPRYQPRRPAQSPARRNRWPESLGWPPRGARPGSPGPRGLSLGRLESRRPPRTQAAGRSRSPRRSRQPPLTQKFSTKCAMTIVPPPPPPPRRVPRPHPPAAV